VTEFVFGYGSLLLLGEVRDDARPSVLHGFRRGWNVAMDNRRDIPGYKYYVDEATGERPAVYVTFLNIWEDDGAQVDGLVFPVDDGTLRALDDRERNYERRDVTAHVQDGFGGRVWAYVGTDDARERFETGRAAGTAVVSAAYESAVGRETNLPLRRLRRIEIPAYSGVT
jgi:cation transport regulator ChaC